VDNLGTVTAIIAGLLSVIAVLIVVIRWTLDKKPTNGNSSKQSRECFEQHQFVLSELRATRQEVAQVQKTLDDRSPLLQKINDKIDDVNISIRTEWNGSDRRK